MLHVALANFLFHIIFVALGDLVLDAVPVLLVCEDGGHLKQLFLLGSQFWLEAVLHVSQQLLLLDLHVLLL